MKRKIRALICILICLTMTASGMGTAAAAEVGASGYSTDGIPLNSTSITLESGKTYTISNVEELYNFAEIVNKGPGKTGTGATVVLKNDIAVNEGVFGTDNKFGSYWEYNPLYNGESITKTTVVRKWTPIGTGQIKCFEETFDGDGHTISGLYSDAGNGSSIGFFGYLGIATVKNLNVSNSYFRGQHCGAICGDLAGGTLENCNTAAYVISSYCGGGIVGQVTHGSDASWMPVSSRIVNCTSESKVLGGCPAGSSAVPVLKNLGGISGSAYDCTISGCFNSGNIKGDTWVGLLIGYKSDTCTLTNGGNSGSAQDKNGQENLVGCDADEFGSTKVKVRIRATMLFDHGSMDDKSCTAYLDEEATRAGGTDFSYVIGTAMEYISVESTGSVVMRIAPGQDCAITSVTGSNCKVEKTGNDTYIMSSFTGDAELTVKVHGDVHKHVLEVINRSRGYVDENGLNRYRIGATAGNYIADVMVNGQSVGAVKDLYVNEGDQIQVYFAKEGETWQETQERDKAGRTEGTVPMTEEQKAKTIAGVQNTTIKAQTVKMYNGAIRVTWKKSAGNKVDCFQVFRSTKKTSGYGKTPVYTTKTGKATYYTNSKALKKGTRYYYKVRGVRVIDGTTYYTKWSNICYRTATKTFR